MKEQVLRGIAKIVKKTAYLGAGRRCITDWHQPKIPQSLLEVKKK